jgi:hypothetical protein
MYCAIVLGLVFMGRFWTQTGRPSVSQFTVSHRRVETPVITQRADLYAIAFHWPLATDLGAAKASAVAIWSGVNSVPRGIAERLNG